MQYIKVLERCLGRKAKLDLLPIQAGDVPVTLADISRLTENLAFEPRVNIEEGVAKFVDWYQSYYKEDGGVS